MALSKDIEIDNYVFYRKLGKAIELYERKYKNSLGKNKFFSKKLLEEYKEGEREISAFDLYEFIESYEGEAGCFINFIKYFSSLQNGTLHGEYLELQNFYDELSGDILLEFTDEEEELRKKLEKEDEEWEELAEREGFYAEIDYELMEKCKNNWQ